MAWAQIREKVWKGHTGKPRKNQQTRGGGGSILVGASLVGRSDQKKRGAELPPRDGEPHARKEGGDVVAETGKGTTFIKVRPKRCQSGGTLNWEKKRTVPILREKKGGKMGADIQEGEKGA